MCSPARCEQAAEGGPESGTAINRVKLPRGPEFPGGVTRGPGPAPSARGALGRRSLGTFKAASTARGGGGKGAPPGTRALKEQCTGWAPQRLSPPNLPLAPPDPRGAPREVHLGGETESRVAGDRAAPALDLDPDWVGVWCWGGRGCCSHPGAERARSLLQHLGDGSIYILHGGGGRGSKPLMGVAVTGSGPGRASTQGLRGHI